MVDFFQLTKSKGSGYEGYAEENKQPYEQQMFNFLKSNVKASSLVKSYASRTYDKVKHIPGEAVLLKRTEEQKKYITKELEKRADTLNKGIFAGMKELVLALGNKFGGINKNLQIYYNDVNPKTGLSELISRKKVIKATADKDFFKKDYSTGSVALAKTALIVAANWNKFMRSFITFLSIQKNKKRWFAGYLANKNKNRDPAYSTVKRLRTKIKRYKLGGIEEIGGAMKSASERFLAKQETKAAGWLAQNKQDLANFANPQQLGQYQPMAAIEQGAQQEAEQGEGIEVEGEEKEQKKIKITKMSDKQIMDYAKKDEIYGGQQLVASLTKNNASQEEILRTVRAFYSK